jgi:hypothetical protein
MSWLFALFYLGSFDSVCPDEGKSNICQRLRTLGWDHVVANLDKQMRFSIPLESLPTDGDMNMYFAQNVFEAFVINSYFTSRAFNWKFLFDSADEASWVLHFTRDGVPANWFSLKKLMRAKIMSKYFMGDKSTNFNDLIEKISVETLSACITETVCYIDLRSDSFEANKEILMNAMRSPNPLSNMVDLVDNQPKKYPRYNWNPSQDWRIDYPHETSDLGDIKLERCVGEDGVVFSGFLNRSQSFVAVKFSKLSGEKLKSIQMIRRNMELSRIALPWVARYIGVTSIQPIQLPFYMRSIGWLRNPGFVIELIQNKLPNPPVSQLCRNTQRLLAQRAMLDANIAHVDLTPDNLLFSEEFVTISIIGNSVKVDRITTAPESTDASVLLCRALKIIDLESVVTIDEYSALNPRIPLEFLKCHYLQSWSAEYAGFHPIFQAVIWHSLKDLKCQSLNLTFPDLLNATIDQKIKSSQTPWIFSAMHPGMFDVYCPVDSKQTICEAIRVHGWDKVKATIEVDITRLVPNHLLPSTQDMGLYLTDSLFDTVVASAYFNFDGFDWRSFFMSSNSEKWIKTHRVLFGRFNLSKYMKSWIVENYLIHENFEYSDKEITERMNVLIHKVSAADLSSCLAEKRCYVNLKLGNEQDDRERLVNAMKIGDLGLLAARINELPCRFPSQSWKPFGGWNSQGEHGVLLNGVFRPIKLLQRIKGGEQGAVFLGQVEGLLSEVAVKFSRILPEYRDQGKFLSLSEMIENTELSRLAAPWVAEYYGTTSDGGHHPLPFYSGAKDGWLHNPGLVLEYVEQARKVSDRCAHMQMLLAQRGMIDVNIAHTDLIRNNFMFSSKDWIKITYQPSVKIERSYGKGFGAIDERTSIACPMMKIVDLESFRTLKEYASYYPEVPREYLKCKFMQEWSGLNFPHASEHDEVLIAVIHYVLEGLRCEAEDTDISDILRDIVNEKIENDSESEFVVNKHV